MSANLTHSGPIAWMVRNPISANILMLVLLFGGLFMAWQIKKEVFPEFDVDVISIEVALPGASPEEVEQSLVLAIEDAVHGIQGIEKMTAQANEGGALVNLELTTGVQTQSVYQEIQQAVDGIRTFPNDAEKPRVFQNVRRRDVMELRIYGHVDAASLQGAAEYVRDQLLNDPAISQIELEGTRAYQIHIDVPYAMLRAHGLTLQQIADTINANALQRSGGSVETRGGEILLRLDERKNWAQEFADLAVISHADGTLVRLGDIASVQEGFEESNKSATFNGQPAIGMQIFRVGDQTPDSIASAVYRILPQAVAQLPQGVHYAVQDDASQVYQERLQLLLKNGFIGLLLVFALLSLFLEFSLAFWVAVGIPTSFLGAFLFLPSLDVSVNMVSMFAFIIALGIVVDDAIIAGENIYEYRQRGLSFVEASIQGTRDIAIPISYSILTNMVAFLPLAFIPGGFGQIWQVIPMVVISVFAISWIEALYILPAHLSQINEKRRGFLANWLHEKQQVFSYGFMHLVRCYYQPFIRWAIRYRYISLALSVGLLVLVVAYPLSGRMGFILMPKVESDYSAASARLPIGATDQEVYAVRDQLQNAIEQVIAEQGGEQLSTGIFSNIQENTIDVRAYLTPAEVRPLSTSQVTQLWREKTGVVTGVDFVKFEADRGGPGRGANITVELNHQDPRLLEKASEQLASAIAEFGNTLDIDSGAAKGKLQYSFRLTEEARSLGLTTAEVARQVRNSFFGAEALRQQRAANELTVLVRLSEEERESAQAIESFKLITPAGGEIPLSQATEVSRVRGDTQIQRSEGRRTVTVSANVEPISDTNRILAALKSDILPQLSQDFPGLSYSFEGRQAEMRDALLSFATNVTLALLVIYILLAIPFGSYIQPVIVMLAIPFGFMGAILGHLMMGYNLSLISIMGIIALSGVVINDSLVMIDYANARRKEGLSAVEAIVQACVRRFRPILLTTVTTFGGLAPMIFETSRQARFMIPMAISLGFGILFATAIMLIFIPCCYLMVEDLRRLFFRPVPDHISRD